ncbi:hypothetical protein DFJ74DRAFT_57641 [Hyaloraphidium curvatum]|nr:hypothetical protein DFJ74DRAFT_57641 [Hyaloraphidium curvatum]
MDRDSADVSSHSAQCHLEAPEHGTGDRAVVVDILNAAEAPADADGKGSFIVTPPEYLAVVPSFPALVPSFSGIPPPPDRAERLRIARPLGKKELLAGLAAQPALRSITALQLWLTPFAARSLERSAVVFIGLAAAVSATWAFRGDLFATKELAIGYATWLAFAAQILLVNPSFDIYRRALGARPRSGSGLLDAFPLAGLARWTELVVRSGKSERFLLLAHDPNDPLCPCSLPGCAGGLGRAIAWLRILEASFRVVLMTGMGLMMIWTPVVTLASEFWTTPWSAALGAFAVLCLAGHNVNPICRFPGNVGTFRLSERVAHKTMKLALADLLLRLRSGASRLGEPVSDEPYAELHAVFTAVWRTRISSFSFSRLTLFSSFGAVVLALINIVRPQRNEWLYSRVLTPRFQIAGLCVPAFYLAYLANVLLSHALIDLISLAASNAQVTSIRDLYLEAQREIRELPVVRGTGLAADIRRHDAVLASYADVARFRGRFLGFAVDYDVVRTVVVVTLVTLVVGLWSIVRGLGITATMDFACRAGS